jgi:4-alpha-glucanotransferase
LAADGSADVLVGTDVYKADEDVGAPANNTH